MPNISVQRDIETGNPRQEGASGLSITSGTGIPRHILPSSSGNANSRVTGLEEKPVSSHIEARNIKTAPSKGVDTPKSSQEEQSSKLNKIIRKIRQHSLGMKLSAELPKNLAEVQKHMINAREALLSLPDDASVSDRQRSLDKFVKANHAHLIAFSNAVHAAKEGDSKAANPNIRNSTANLLLGIANNFAYTIGPMIATSVEGSLNKQLITAPVTAALVPGFSALSQQIKSAVGIASPQLLLATHASGINGPLKAMGPKIVDQLVGTLIYALTRAAMVQTNKSEDLSAKDIMFAGLVAALAMNFAKELAYNLLANSTLKSNNARDVSELPVMDGSRANNMVVTYRNTPNNNDMKWTMIDTAKTMTGFNMGVAGAVGLGVSNILTSGLGDGVASEFGKVLAGFTAFFGMKDVIESVGIMIALDPRANPRHAISGLQGLQQSLRESSAESIISQLNHVTSFLASADPDDLNISERKQLRDFQNISAALSREPSNQPRTDDDYGSAAKAIMSAAESLLTTDNSDYMIVKAHNHLKFAASYVEDMSPNSPRLNRDHISHDNLVHLEGSETMELARSHIRLAQAALTHANIAHGNVDYIDTVANIIIPVFAALREFDMRQTSASFLIKLASLDEPDDVMPNNKSKEIWNQLSIKGTNEIVPQVLANIIGNDEETKADAINHLRRISDSSDNITARIRSALTQNIIMRTDPNHLRSPTSETRHMETILNSLENSDSSRLGEVGNEIVNTLSAAEIDIVELKKTLKPILENDDIMDSIGDQSPPLRSILNEVSTASPNSQTNQLVVVAKDTVRTMALDTVNIHRKHQELFDIASTYRPTFGEGLYGNTDDSINMNVRQKDVHFHPSDYDSRRNSDLILTYLMGHNGIDHTLYEGIPHTMKDKSYYDKVLPRPNANALSYVINGNNSGANILRYDTSQDHKLATSLRSTMNNVPNLLNNVSLSITGFDINDSRHMTDHMDEVMRQFPELVKSVGEVTLYKEVVSKASAQIPEIDSKATRTLLDATAERGLPLVLHCDVGTPGNKGKFRSALVKVLREMSQEINTSDGKLRKNDKLRMSSILSGNRNTPPKHLSVVWAHGAGISRYTRAASDHTKELVKLFEDPLLKDSVTVDLSWDYVSKNMILNTSDLFQKNHFPKTITDGLQAILKSYDSFLVQGSRADEANDGINKNIAALHMVATDNLAKQHLEILSSFKATLENELSDNPTLLRKFTHLMNFHGDQGNNWLNLMMHHSEKMMYGSDSLTPGAKYHGEMAYGLNTKMLYPLYDIFTAVGNELEKNGSETVDDSTTPEQCHKVVSDIARDTFNSVIENASMKMRRDAYLQMIMNTVSKPTANIAPIGRDLGV